MTAGPNHPFTFQLRPEGYKWLLTSRLSHKSEIDWDVFETLRSLGLLYTLDSDCSPSDAPLPDDLSFEELSADERVQLGTGLLSRFTAAELSGHNGTLNFLLSFGDLDWEFQKPILEVLLTGTPFEPPVISDYQEAFEEYGDGFYWSECKYNTVLLALVLAVAYDAIEPMDDVESINEGNPVWVYDNWTVCAGTELIFYEVRDEIREAVPDPLYQELAETSESVRNEGHFYSFLMGEFAALSEFQFIMRVQDLNPWLGRIIADGLKAEYPNSVLILPGAHSEANGPFEVAVTSSSP